jgi:hypothetical protein
MGQQAAPGGDRLRSGGPATGEPGTRYSSVEPKHLDILGTTLIRNIHQVMRQVRECCRNLDQNTITRFQAKPNVDGYFCIRPKLFA